jgi:hypothetical protein
MNLRRVALVTILASAVALVLTVRAGGGPTTGAAPNQEKPPMSQAPSSSRPPSPVVAPVEHDGVRYVQDSFDERQGDQPGGYLAAVDAKTGARLWRLQVYPVPDYRSAGLPAMVRNFRAMRLAADGRALEIENESGALYRVELATRAVSQLSGPPATAADTPAKPKPKPKP